MADRFEQRDSRGERGYGSRHRSSDGGYDGGGSWGSSDARGGERRGEWGSNRGGSDYSGGSRSFGRGGGGRSSNYQRRDGGGYNSDERGGSRGGGGYEQRGGGNRSYENGDKSTIKILSSDVGRVIGRGGSTIKDLQSKSGARIKVHNRNNFDEEGNQTSVDLFGTTEERGKAEELINEITSQTRPSKQQRTYEDDSNE